MGTLSNNSVFHESTAIFYIGIKKPILNLHVTQSLLCDYNNNYCYQSPNAFHIGERKWGGTHLHPKFMYVNASTKMI